MVDLIKLANDIMDAVRDDPTGFWLPLLVALGFICFFLWFIDEMGMLYGASYKFSVRTFKYWVRHNWAYLAVALWYWPRLSTVLRFVDVHGPMMIFGLLAATMLFMAVMFVGRGDLLLMSLIFNLARIVYAIDYVLRSMLNAVRFTLKVIGRFPLQFAALALLIVVAGSVQQPSPVSAESGQIITVEEVVNNIPQPAAETVDEPYAPETHISGARFVTELVTQSPIVSGRINDAYVVAETNGIPIRVRWITEGRTAIIDVLSDEPVMIGYGGIGRADELAHSDDVPYKHGKLFKLVVPEDWKEPNFTIGITNDTGSSIHINWFPQ